MNYGAPLRIEFLLPGAAALASTSWLVVAVGSAMGGEPGTAVVRATQDLGTGSVRAVVVLILLVAAMYCTGVVVVMGTFVWPASRLVHNARALRLRDLHELRKPPVANECQLSSYLTSVFKHEIEPKKRDPVWSRRWWGSPKRWWRQLFSFLEPAFEPHLAISLARKDMSGAAQAEIEYRRSIRQIALGVVPGVVIATVAAQVETWSRDSAVGDQVLLCVLFLVVGVAMACGLMSTAAYQENVAQGLLLDLAFLKYWELLREDRSLEDRQENREVDRKRWWRRKNIVNPGGRSGRPRV